MKQAWSTINQELTEKSPVRPPLITANFVLYNGFRKDRLFVKYIF